MEIFKLHDQVVQDYRSYSESFVNIADDGIHTEVTRALSELWPEGNHETHAGARK